MSVKRIIAIVFIFLLSCGAWMVLGTTTMVRSTGFQSKLRGEVESLYGRRLLQQSPTLHIRVPGTDQMRQVMPSANKIDVKLISDPRKKGLIWYPTYQVVFHGTYSITNTEAVAQKNRMQFSFPENAETISDFGLTIDGKEQQVDAEKGISEIIEVAPGETRQFQITYSTRGQGVWRYVPAAGLGQVQKLDVQISTNFTDVDYPQGCLSPTNAKQSKADGMLLSWITPAQISKQQIGVIIPERLNPGPVTSRITFFAPICLLFFFFLVATINVIYKTDIHPMHYLFISAGFFAFHLLMSYMVAVMPMQFAFAIAAVVSVVLVTGYLGSALRGKFPWLFAAIGQLFFLVMFSYTFFFKGATGLTVAIGSVITLAILMKVTAKTDWAEVFRKQTPEPPEPEDPESDIASMEAV